MIKIESLKKDYRRKRNTLCAIEDINLDIRKGEIIAVIGPSGCGKTTLLKLIAGLLLPTKGKIIADNSNMSIVFQNLVLLPWRTVEENVRLSLEFKHAKDNSAVAQIIELVGLSAFGNSYPNELSGGMAQRVALARALVANPGLLLMDEAFGSLDEITRNKLNLELLRIWKELGTTIILVTHSISEAVFLSDRVVVLSQRPAKIKEIIDINLQRPRISEIKETMKFQEYVRCIRKNID